MFNFICLLTPYPSSLLNSLTSSCLCCKWEFFSMTTLTVFMELNGQRSLFQAVEMGTPRTMESLPSYRCNVV